MTFSHHVERNTKALSQRRIRNARSEVGQVRVETREQLEEWYDQLGHPGKQSLGAMAAQAGVLLSGQPVLEELVQSTGGDPARTDLILKQAVTPDEGERTALIEEIQAKVAEDLSTVPLLQGTQIAANTDLAISGATHSCGVTVDERAYCWGDNSFGQLGDGEGWNSLVPVPVAGPARWAELTHEHEAECEGRSGEEGRQGPPGAGVETRRDRDGEARCRPGRINAHLE